MKSYEIKPYQKIEALREVAAEIVSHEDEAIMLGKGEAKIWAYQEVRDMLRARIESLAGSSNGRNKGVR